MWDLSENDYLPPDGDDRQLQSYNDGTMFLNLDDGDQDKIAPRRNNNNNIYSNEPLFSDDVRVSSVEHWQFSDSSISL